MRSPDAKPRSRQSSAQPSAPFSSDHDLREVEVRSPYAIAQDGLAEIVDAAVQAQRVEAMNAAVRVDVIALAMRYAMSTEMAFTAPTLSPHRRREMASRSIIAELATALRVPERTMQRQVSEAWALSTELPTTLRAMRIGDVSLQHARVIIEETADLGDEPRLRAQLDERLAVEAGTTTAATLRRRARALREELQIETLAERHRAARAQRRIELEPARDGMSWLHALLPAADASLIKDRLDGIAQGAVEDDRLAESMQTPSQKLRADQLRIEQLRADATRDLLLYGTLPAENAFAGAAESIRATVHVTVPVLTLIGESDEAGVLDGYGPIDADTARRLAASAPSFVRLLTHPVSGTVLDVDRTTYRPPADLKRWLQVRDGTCRFPGCNRRAARCEIDHSVDWQDEGCTAFDNLAHLCALHHHLKHETSWSVRHHAGGVLEWTSPAGRTHVSHPGRRVTGGADSQGPPGRGPTGSRHESTNPTAAKSEEPDPDFETQALRQFPPPPESPPF